VTILDEPEQLNRDTEAAKRAFERFLLAPYEKDIVLVCDMHAPENCEAEAEWWLRCNTPTCRAVFVWCGSHHNTYSVASFFGEQVGCPYCGALGPLTTTFTLGLLRSPA